MRNKDKWFEFLTTVVTRFLFGNPVRKAGSLMVTAALGILASPVWLAALLEWAGIEGLVNGTSDIIIGFALLLLGVSLIIGEYVWASLPPPPDQLLLNEVRQKLPRDMVNFIRDHQFGNGFDLNRVRGVIELADEWRNSERRFDDNELQNALMSLIGASQRFTSIIRQEMRPIDPGSSFMLIRRPENGYGNERPYSEVSQALLSNARNINEAYEAIIIRAKALKLNFVTHP